MSLVLTALLLLAPIAPAQATPAADTSQAHIVLDRTDDMLRISGTFTGAGGLPATLTYRLAVERMGAAGNSTTRQSGTFAPIAGRTVTLSTARVNVQAGDRLRVHLSILNGERIVAEDVVSKVY